MTTDPMTAPNGAQATSVPLPPTSLVLSTRGRPAFVDDLVTSISAGDEVPTEFVIIDQSDAPNPVLATGHVDGRCEIRYVWSPERGLSRGRNLGIATARHDIIAFLDDDMFVPPAWFGTLIRTLVAAGTDTVVTGRVIAGEEEADGAFAPSTSPDAVARTYRGRIGRDVLLPHNMAMYRTAIEAVGPFDPRLGVGSGFPSSEDNDFGYRLLEHGFTIAYVPDAVLIHRAWRSPSAWIPLRWAYGRGQGAYFAKHASRQDRYMTRRLWRDVTRHAKRAPRRALTDPRLAMGDLVYALAVLEGAAEWLATARWRR